MIVRSGVIDSSPFGSKRKKQSFSELLFGFIVQKFNLHYSTSYHSSPISKYLTGSFVMKKNPS